MFHPYASFGTFGTPLDATVELEYCSEVFSAFVLPSTKISHSASRNVIRGKSGIATAVKKWIAGHYEPSDHDLLSHWVQLIELNIGRGVSNCTLCLK